MAVKPPTDSLSLCALVVSHTTHPRRYQLQSQNAAGVDNLGKQGLYQGLTGQLGGIISRSPPPFTPRMRTPAIAGMKQMFRDCDVRTE